jgi:hypothetical protein
MPRLGAARLVFTVTTLVTICASAAGATARTQGGGPNLSIALSNTVYRPGDTMTLTATLAAGAVSDLVDAYVVVQLPTGQYFSLQLGGSLVPGIVPIARALMPVAYQATLVQYTFSTVEPLGNYTWYAVLARPNTLEFVSTLQQTAFALTSLSTPETTRSELSAALKNGDLNSALELVGEILSDVITSALGPTARQTVATALETCRVVDSSPEYQLCVTPDERFRFLLVQDEEHKIWRVIVW